MVLELYISLSFEKLGTVLRISKCLPPLAGYRQPFSLHGMIANNTFCRQGLRLFVRLVPNQESNWGRGNGLRTAPPVRHKRTQSDTRYMRYN